MVRFSSEQRAVAEHVREIAESELSANAFTWEGEIPWQNVKTLADHGIIGINMPEAYGGEGRGGVEALLALEIVSSVCPDTGFHIFGMLMGAPPAVATFGSDRAKETYLRPVCQGKTILPIAMSEPGAGSDLGSAETKIAESADGEWTLSGEKAWVGDIPSANAAVVWAKFPDETLGSVIVELDAPGIEIVQNYENMMAGTQTQFTMNEVEIPDENVLIRGPEALKQQLRSFNWERLGSAAFASGIARCALRQAVEHANERVQFDQPIGEFQGIRWKIAEMAKQIRSTQALTYEAAHAAETSNGTPNRLDSSVAKLHSGRMVENVVTESLQVFGARGYQRGHPLEYLYRMGRSRRIAGGTDEMMLNAIADVLMDEGRLADPV